MARRNFESEAASMFDEEDFDAAYKGTVSSIPDTADEDDDEDDVDDSEEVDAESDDDATAWAETESAETATEEEVVAEEEVEVEEVGADEDGDEDEAQEDDDAEVSAARDILSKRSSNVKKREGMTKAEMIRDEIEKRKASDDSLRACDIIAALKKRGTEVNASQVSVTLRNMGVASMRGKGEKKPVAAVAAAPRGRRPKAEAEVKSRVHHKAAATEKAPLPRVVKNGEAFTEADLTATTDFLAAVGGAERGATLLRIFGRMNG